METNLITITRDEAIIRIVKFMSLSNYQEVTKAEMLLGTFTNHRLMDMLGFINYVKNNSLEVTNTIIKNTLWNDINEYLMPDSFFLSRTNNYSQYNTLDIS